MLTLTLSQARHLHLAAQGLMRVPRRRATPNDVLTSIRNMGALQIDTISVVARSPYFVLFSRLGPYQETWLDDCLASGKLFEYWAHEACFLPIEDFGLYWHRMTQPEAMGWKYNAAWMREHRDSVLKLLDHVREHGPVRSADFERADKGNSGWWGWKPEKRSLEVLFTAGELMIARRQSFQRVYDLRSRVHPAWQSTHAPSIEEVRRRFMVNAVRALGVTRTAWVADYFRCRKGFDAAHPDMLFECEDLIEVAVEGWNEPAFIHRDRWELAQAVSQNQLRSTLTSLLSPFDPVVWDRKRARELFDFDYVLECYTPAPKRRHGYFVLPVLRNGSLIGRVDAKAHRAQGVFEIKALHLEAGVRESAALYDDVGRAIARCAQWHATPDVRLTQAPTRTLKRGLEAVWRDC